MRQYNTKELDLRCLSLYNGVLHDDNKPLYVEMVMCTSIQICIRVFCIKDSGFGVISSINRSCVGS